ncbi:MAG: hypothetical protein V4531_04975 [Actinomycetota bacterium]
MTLDTYVDLFDDDLSRVALRLNDAAISTDVVKMWSEAPLAKLKSDTDIPKFQANKGM